MYAAAPSQYGENRLPTRDPALFARLPGDTMIILGTFVFLYDMLAKRLTLRSVSLPRHAKSGGSSNRVMVENDDKS